MKKVIILFIGLLIGHLIFAQEKQSWITIKGGASIPVGIYGGTDLDKSCFTQTGINVGVEGAWAILNYLGIGGQFGLNLHPVDVTALGWEEVQADPSLEDLYIRSEPYQSITAMLGVYGNYTIWGQLQVNAKLMGGVMWMKTPYKLYKQELFFVGEKWAEITSARDYNFAFAAGLGLQYNFSTCIGLKVEAEYDYSNMVFGFSTGSVTRDENRKISYINTTLGLVILF